MRVTSTVDEYVALAAITDPVIRMEAWVRDYEAAHRDIFDVYYRSWSSPVGRVGGVRDVPVIAPYVRDLEERAIALASRTEDEFRGRGLIDQLDVVLLVGNHTSNGWVAEINGQQSLFLALEFLGDPPFDGVLVTHEAVHVAHMQFGAAEWPEDVGACLIQEGIATAVCRELHPGLSESGYLWTDDKHVSWVQDCCESEQDIALMVLREMATLGSDPHVKGLFAADSRLLSLPSRCGYWVGDRLVQRWLVSNSVRDILEWGHSEAVRRAQMELRLALA
jgi:hypothetical protein